MREEREIMVATVLCPKCGKEFSLLDATKYAPGQQSQKFPGAEPMTFPCCNDARTVQPESVEYRLQ